MKRLLSLLLVALCLPIVAQDKADRFTSGGAADSSRDPRTSYMEFVPNEIVLKFDDKVTVRQGSRVKASGVSGVDAVLQRYGVTELEKMIPQAEKPQRIKRMKNPQGLEVEVPRIDNIYRILLPPNEKTPVNIHQVMEELKQLEEVAYAEPNYIYSVDQLSPVGPELSAEQVGRVRKMNQSTSAVVPNDPLYAEQWYIPAVKADMVWEQTTGDTTQVIAILDTGVDWTHPDLKNKMWRNPGEIPDNGIDDDGNGFVDDWMGWDYINHDNNPMDDNSHGTHVAGIAAAEANNGIGIAGVNWHARIMPLKVFQSSGRGDALTISRGITYAFQKGATVINMSFGSYARSLAMEDALANAYATTLLVAAAGNDGIDIEFACFGKPFYPAAFSFVLGVMAFSSFSNSDCTGPTYSNHPDLLNYELIAPGTNIFSTIPNGNYRAYQGTSMATPVVAGAISLYRNLFTHDNESNEFMWVKLIQSTSQYLDIYKALTIIPKPEIWVLNKTLVDTLGVSDRDGRVDAGESIQLWFKARNTGGQVDSVYFKIQMAEFEDTSTCHIVKSTSCIGTVSPYAIRTSENDPIVLNFSPKVANGRDINFDVLSWYKGASDTLTQRIVVTPENGIELSGVMDTTLILTANKLWIVNQSFRITGNLIIHPGVNLVINNSIDNRGMITAVGTKDSIIIIKGPKSILGSGSLVCKYVKFHSIEESLGATRMGGASSAIYENCIFEDMYALNASISLGYGLFPSYSINMTDCLIKNSFVNTLFAYAHQPFNFNNNTVDNVVSIGGTATQSTSGFYFSNNNFFRLKDYSHIIYGSNNFSRFLMYDRDNYGNGPVSLTNNNIITASFKNIYFLKATGSSNVLNVSPQYWGTTKVSRIQPIIYDFFDDSGLPEIRFSPMLSQPSALAHAIVWKVLINGQDPQDEAVNPIGVGKQRFDVYFNRPMDKSYIPRVSFGVRYPYSSITVNEDGVWSEDGTVYTVYKTIKLTTGDGLNRIRVSDAKELDGWEHFIPIEDSRFEFLINAAGSASIEFIATPGLGKVALEWNHNDLEDGLGYNMYRMEHINDSTLTQPVIINNSLITDTLYTDYSVVPNKRYYYYYKILRTNMAETDSSRVVSAVPFTAAKGDANGDLSVNVLDVTTIVAHLLNMNPQPFIRDAADVNTDTQVNILDIVGVVNLVLGGPQQSQGIAMNKQVDLYTRNDTLFANTNTEIGAIQFDLEGVSAFEELKVLEALKPFETGNSSLNGALRLIFYSMSGKSIAPGEAIPLLKLKAGSSVNDAIVGEPNGTSIKVNYLQTRIPDISDNMNQRLAELGNNYPNPVTGSTTIPVKVYEPVDELIVRIVNTLGQEVDVIRVSNPVVGDNLISWKPLQQKGLLIYKLEIRQGNQRSIAPANRMMIK